MIEIDPSFPKIEEEFNKYFSNERNPTSEKMFVLYAAYIDYLNMIDSRKEKIYKNKVISSEKLGNWVTYYLKSINSGCSLLWHTLPKILEIWFQLKDNEEPLKEVIERELIKLDTFKIVQILQILLSRFSLIKYRDTIVKLISKVAAKYPLQSAWWLSHFKHFYSYSEAKHILQIDKNNRDWFVNKIVNRCIKLCSSNEEWKLMEYDSKLQQESKFYEFNRIFNATSDLMDALIKFGNKEILDDIRKVEIPSEIRKIDFSKNYIIMPIDSNLKSCLPKPDDDLKTFNCYNSNPVRIVGVQKTWTLMDSKDRPKKIGFYGSDNRIYYFLLKSDTIGDLRKEARFMNYANLINTIFENDPECKSRNLNLHTYSIVPLSRSTGLIEWMQNT